MSSSSSSPAEVKRVETDPAADESAASDAVAVPEVVSQDGPLTETREFPPDASVSAPNVIAASEQALADDRAAEPPLESEVEAGAELQAVSEAELEAAELEAAELEDADIEEPEALSNEDDAVPAPVVEEPLSAEASAEADEPEVELDLTGEDAADLVIEADAGDADALVDGEPEVENEALRADVAAALADASPRPEQITPAPAMIDEQPFAAAAADEEFLRRVVLPPPSPAEAPVMQTPVPASSAAAAPAAPQVEEESDERTVISEPPSPEMLAALALPRVPAAAHAAAPFARYQSRPGRRVSLSLTQLFGLLLVASLGGGIVGGMLRSSAPAGAVGSTAAVAPTPVITPLPPQEEMIPRAERPNPIKVIEATKPAPPAPAPAPATAPAAAPVAAAPAVATPPVAAAPTPPATKPAAPAPAVAKPAPAAARPAAVAVKPAAAVKVAERPTPPRRTAVNRRPVAKKKKFVDPFE